MDIFRKCSILQFDSARILCFIKTYLMFNVTVLFMIEVTNMKCKHKQIVVNAAVSLDTR